MCSRNSRIPIKNKLGNSRILIKNKLGNSRIPTKIKDKK